jgi:ribosomal protein S25
LRARRSVTPTCRISPQRPISETELRLRKEIAQIRAERRADIAGGRNAPRETETRLRKEIAQIRAALHAKEIETVRKEIARITPDVLRVIVPLMLAQVAAIAARVKLL